MKEIRTNFHGGEQGHVDRIVIHATVSPCVRGGAVSVAHYFQSPKAGGSAHYVVDPGEVVRCLAESTIGYHAPPNTASIGVELCDPQKGSSARWSDANHEAMLRLAARLVWQVAKRWGVPLRRLSVAELKAGKHGICGHVDVSNAFHQSDHSDPGDAFPWDHFMALVAACKQPDTEPDVDGVPEFQRPLKLTSPMMRGDDVRVWQGRAREIGFVLDVDGVYGGQSETVCRALQLRVGIPVTGVVDEETWLLTHIWDPESKEKS